MESRDLDEARFEESRTPGNWTLFLITVLLPVIGVLVLLSALYGCL